LFFVYFNQTHTHTRTHTHDKPFVIRLCRSVFLIRLSFDRLLLLFASCCSSKSARFSMRASVIFFPPRDEKLQKTLNKKHRNRRVEKRSEVSCYYALSFRVARQSGRRREKKIDTDRDDFIERVRWTGSAGSPPSPPINVSSYIHRVANLVFSRHM